MLEGSKYDVVVCFAGWNMSYFDKFENVNRIINRDVFSGLSVLGNLSTVAYEFYEFHRDELEMIYEKLVDLKSRDCFSAYINQRISGKYEYSDGLVDRTQYFDDTIYTLSREELFIDCGGYDGGDSKTFLNRAGENSHALIFEADKRNIQKINENLSEFKNQYEIIDKAVLDKQCVLKFKSEGNMDSKISDDGDIEVECVAIDDYLRDRKATFLKMDIEGAELKALQGAKETITRCRPRMAICIYHKPEDIYEIPIYIMSLNPDYKLFVRRYDSLCIETVLFAV